MAEPSDALLRDLLLLLFGHPTSPALGSAQETVCRLRQESLQWLHSRRSFKLFFTTARDGKTFSLRYESRDSHGIS